MSGVLTSLRGDAHDYTRSKTPWILGDRVSPCGKLIKYLSGGGLKSFGRTVVQEEAHTKHVRFVTAASVFGVLWALFYFL